MPLHIKLPFYLFLVYPLVGFITITFWGQPPFILLSLFVIVAFIDKIGRTNKLIFPAYLKHFLLFIISVVISKYFINGFRFRIDTHFAQVFYSVLAMFFFIIIENTRFSESFIKTSLLIIKLLIITAAVVSIVQYFNAAFFVNTQLYAGDEEVVGYARRIGSIFTWGDFNASRYLAIGLIIMYGIVIFEFKNRKFAFWAFQLLVALVVITGQARIAMVTFVVTTLMLVYNKLSIKNILVITVSSFAFLIVLNFIDFNLDYFVANRLKSESAYTRLEAFTAFFHAFPEKPFFGTGGVRTEALITGFGRVGRLHNAHLGTAYYYGIFAFLFHTLFIVALTKKTYKTGKLAGYWPPFVGMLCYIIATMTMPSGFFLEPGLIIMVVFNKYHYDRYLLLKFSSQNMTADRGNHLTLNKVSHA